MNKILAVIRREFIERVRTKTFIVTTVIVPLVLFGFGFLPQLLLKRDSRSRQVIVLDATTGGVGDSVIAVLGAMKLSGGDGTLPRFQLQRLAASPADVPRLRDSLISQVGVGSETHAGLDGLLVLTDQGVDSGRVTYFGSNVASFSDMGALERALGPVLRSQRLRMHNADAALIAAASVQLDLEKKKVSEGKVTGESGESSFWLAYITSFVMYFSLLMYGIQVMGAVLEEKTSRIVEILISSLTPFQLLLGKVVGVAGAGLLQLGIWGMTSFYITSMMARPRSGVEDLAVDGTRRSFDFPAVSVELILVVLVCFLLGFLLYSALYAAVGAMCSTQQETQQAAQPVTIILAMGFISMFALINDPSSQLARVLSFIPLFTPLVLPVRYALSPLPLGEVLAAVLAMMLGVVAIAWLAGRIYRVGILSYGKKPSLKELVRWVRAG